MTEREPKDMTAARRRLVETIWGGLDPFSSPPSGLVDHQGWHYDNPLLVRAIEDVRPGIVVEVGVWKGASVITMARRMRELRLDAVVLAIDTWLGSWDHWLNAEWHPSLGLENGYPTIYRTFEANVHEQGLTGYVLPLPTDSGNAAQILKHHGLAIDVLHIDGAHDYDGVMGDLKRWWPLLRPGGVLLGDDYYEDRTSWPEVFEAFNDFFGVAALENQAGKCWVRKEGP